MPLPNPLYSIHVNAAVAGPSTQRLQPLSNAPDASFYPMHLVQQFRTPQAPRLPSKPSALAEPLPPSLMPGGAGRSRSGVLSTLESSLIFQPNATSSSATSSSSPAYSRPRLYSENLSSTRPLLPPKPRVQTRNSLASLGDMKAPKIPPKPFVPSEKQAMISVATPDADYAEEEELLARALEISLKDSGATGRPDLEDDILERVLEESMACIDSSAAHDIPHACQKADSRQFEMSARSTSSSRASSSVPSIVDTPPSSAYPNSLHDDSAEKYKPHIAVKTDLDELTKREQDLIRAEDEARRRQLEMDEEFARSIARLEAAGASSSSMHSSPSSAGVVPSALSASTSSDNVSRPPLNNETRPSSLYVAALQQQSPHHPYTSLPSPPIAAGSRPLPNLGRGHGSHTSGGPVTPAVPPLDKLGRSVSAQAAIPTTSSIEGSPIRPSSYHANSVIPMQYTRNSVSPESIGPAPDENDVLENSESPLMSPISIDEPDEGKLLSNSGPSSPPIVEEELRLGVSFGFNAPSIARGRDPMQGPIPNIITLPFGKCPPLHIQAPNWKHLLKLLTRLSDSRVEPTVEALASTKSELKLRTVIQFMKIHHSSNDWRTIVYLTIDVPVPPSAPNMHKYTNGDINTLPYSYTMSPLPALLRAGAGDSTLSKCFTVPATANTPYPTLPMTLPELALYLLAVLDESRRAANDSSGGLRKLAKTIDSLYPVDSLEGVAPEFDFPNKGGVGKFFKRVVGRASRESSHNQRGGNVERFEYITPFRIDEYH
ncbi:hypothetical protein A7U60_g4996 [Sanghuangporus baumii]|uniref:Uncharacterized protein n=1 Tax=Sanghuangporus baumii TaxID=108892 RepID=A0A9Q5HY45_SANBA|nr:hypothetical protein A7U60_g4996 [Sanghuangporus baumii]